MTKAEHIEYWIDLAERDWQVAQNMFSTKDYVWCLFLAHITIEKLCKAVWVQDNVDNIPPRTHNIIRLLDATTFQRTPAQTVLAATLNNFQLESRYPGDTAAVYKAATSTFASNILHDTEDFRQCLLNKLP